VNCAHLPCTCQETPITENAQEFSSEECANDARTGEPECHCPHADCGGHAPDAAIA